MFYQLLNLIQVNPERRQNQELPVQMFDLLVQFGHRAQGLVLQVVQVLRVLQVTYNEAFDHTER